MGDDDRRTAGDGRRIPRVLAGHEHERRRAIEQTWSQGRRRADASRLGARGPLSLSVSDAVRMPGAAAPGR